jgi:hypothetical protein
MDKDDSTNTNKPTEGDLAREDFISHLEVLATHR